MTQAQQGIRSLETGIRVFREVRALQRPVTLTEISKLARMPPAKAHRYCVSLIRAGLLQQDGRGLYAVGPFGYALGHVRSDFDDMRDLAMAALPALVAEIGETVFVSCWGQTGPLILKVEEAAKPIAIRPTTKGDLPILNSSAGRVFAAYMDKHEITRLVEAEIAGSGVLARERPARLREFFRHLEDVHRRGVARTTGERYPGLVSFSAPIFDRNGRVVLALTSFGLSASFPIAWNAPVPNALRHIAGRITTQIGGSKPNTKK